MRCFPFLPCLLVVSMAGLNAKELVRFGDYRIQVRENFCGEVVFVTMRADHSDTFEYEPRGFWKAVKVAGETVERQCGQVRQLVIKGYVNGVEVYTGVAFKDYGWGAGESQEQPTEMAGGKGGGATAGQDVVARDQGRREQGRRSGTATRSRRGGRANRPRNTTRVATVEKSSADRTKKETSSDPKTLQETTTTQLPASQEEATVVSCGEIPREYQEREFGATLFALEIQCMRTFSGTEQLVIGGLAQGLLKNCDLPRDLASRKKLQTFLISSAFAGVIGTDYGGKDLGKSLGNQVSSSLAYNTGYAVTNDLPCDDPGLAKIADGVVAYLEHTARPVAGGFVQGCVEYYAGRFSQEKCQCIADVGRAVYPDIHSRPFSRDLIKGITYGNPFVGIQMGIQCQLGNY